MYTELLVNAEYNRAYNEGLIAAIHGKSLTDNLYGWSGCKKSTLEDWLRAWWNIGYTDYERGEV